MGRAPAAIKGGIPFFYVFLRILLLMQTDKVRKYFDSRASSYSDDSSRGIWRYIRLRELTSVKEGLKNRKFDSILELGCGSGYYTRELCLLSDNVEVIDLSIAMLNSLKMPNVLKTHADFINYEPNGKFKLIFCAGALEYVEDPFEVLKRYLPYLTANGEFLLLLPRKNLWGLVYRAYYFFKKIRIELFSEREIIRFSEKMGLECKYLKLGFPFFFVALLKKLGDGPLR